MLKLKEKLTFRCESEEEAKALIESFKQKGGPEGFNVNKVSYQYKEKRKKGEVIDACWVTEIENIYAGVWSE